MGGSRGKVPLVINTVASFIHIAQYTKPGCYEHSRRDVVWEQIGG